MMALVLAAGLYLGFFYDPNKYEIRDDKQYEQVLKQTKHKVNFYTKAVESHLDGFASTGAIDDFVAEYLDEMVEDAYGIINKSLLKKEDKEELKEGVRNSYAGQFEQSFSTENRGMLEKLLEERYKQEIKLTGLTDMEEIFYQVYITISLFSLSTAGLLLRDAVKWKKLKQEGSNHP